VPGDRFVVNKLDHPARWDLVTYHSTTPGAPVYCKRVVGLPGEKVRFDQGNVYINDQLMVAPPVVAGRYHATLPTVRSTYRDGETIGLNDREFFVVGDNVDVSADSRIYGPTDRSAIVGVVDFVYWPPGDARVVRY
jgi:signal peptidase I